MMCRRKTVLILALALAAVALPATASAEGELNSGDTAWMLTSTALVLFMTLPGLALFYGGLVRARNVLSVLMQCFAIAGVMTILWVLFGYSLAFEGEGPFIGNLGKAFFRGVTVDSLSGTIPETVFAMFQLTFMIITPALIVGGFAERMKFSAMLWFMGIWAVVVYIPVAHWVWGGGWLGTKDVYDFAGGTVVHITAGFSALVAALMLGKRKGYPDTPMPPHSLTITVIGAGMLWVGWFGFNAGSELAADGVAGMAMTVTQISAATAAVTWMFIEWFKHGKPSVLGMVTGAVGGLVSITPASGFVGPMGGLAIGFAAGVVCFWGTTSLKRLCGYDDALDAFGVHGIGGFLGALLTGIFCATSLGGSGFPEGRTMASQFAWQFIAAAATAIYSVVLSFIILKIIDAAIGLRVSASEEEEGLDLVLHDERGYNL